MEVSVICLCYNSSWEKLKHTLNSLVTQTDVEFEIVIADDGSEDTHENELLAYFREKQFERFQFSFAPENGGTVCNLYRALSLAKGKYIKAIAPGDLLHDPGTLSRWVRFMEETDADVSFSDAVYYTEENGEVRFVETRRSPQNLFLYDGSGKRRDILVDYLLANDTALGAALLYKSACLLPVLSSMVGRVRFAEDFSVRLLVYGGNTLIHFPEAAIYYEYGSGISSSKNKKWEEILRQDFETTNRIIVEQGPSSDRDAERIRRYFASDRKNAFIRKAEKVLRFPSVIRFRAGIRRAALKTPVEEDTAKLF